MIYRARVVADDPMREGIHIVIGLPGGDENTPTSVVVSIGMDNGPIIQDIPPNTTAPTMFIPDDIARPLLDALARHYGSTGDTRTLRKDYEAERARVDRLIDVLAQPPPAVERRAS